MRLIFDLKINRMASGGDGPVRASSASIDGVDGAVGGEPSVQAQRASVPPALRVSVCGRSLRIGEALVLPERASVPPPEPPQPARADRAPLSTLPEKATLLDRTELDDPIEFSSPESSSRTPLHKIPTRAVVVPGTEGLAERAEERVGTSDIHGMHLIVVEDDPSVADAMARQLRSRGAVVAVARNGEHGADPLIVSVEANGPFNRKGLRSALSKLRAVHPWLPAVAISATAMIVLHGVVGLSLDGRAVKGRPEAAPLAKADPASSAQPAPPPSLAARAELGDIVALAEIERRAPADRRVDEVLALTRGHDLLERRSITDVGARIALEPSIAAEPSTLRKLKQAAADPIVYTEALQVIASLPGPTAADLLYDVWLRTGRRQPTNRLAERLLHADPVRLTASPALEVALDLQTVDRCERLVALLPRVTESGDRRSLPLLMRLPHRRCAPASAKNCYYCVHRNPELRRAILAASKRPAPTFN